MVAGNTLVGVFAAGGVTITSVTDTLPDTWVKAASNHANANGDNIENDLALHALRRRCQRRHVAFRPQ